MTSTQIFLALGPTRSLVHDLQTAQPAEMAPKLDAIMDRFLATDWTGAVFSGDERTPAYRENLSQMKTDFGHLYNYARIMDDDPSRMQTTRELALKLREMLGAFFDQQSTFTADRALPFLGVVIPFASWNGVVHRIAVFQLLAHTDPQNYMYITTSPLP